jgi:site-specific recombinase XerD
MGTDLTVYNRQQQIKALVLDAVTSPHTKGAYGRALGDFLDWYRQKGHPLLDKAIVQEYKAELQARGLTAANVNQRLSA